MKIRNLVLLVFVSSLLLWSTGCMKHHGLEGNGTIESETRMSVSFNKVENMGEFNVVCVYDTIFKVVIEAESNLIPYIHTVVNGNTLRIDTYENLDNNYVMKVTVHSPVLQGVELSGSGLIEVEPRITESFEASLSGSGNIYGSISTGNFEAISSGSGDINFSISSTNAYAKVRGSGDIKLSGTSTSGYFENYGSGDIDAFSLPIKSGNASINGSGSIYVLVSDFLIAKIFGSGDIVYRGNPVIESEIRGSGNVIGG